MSEESVVNQTSQISQTTRKIKALPESVWTQIAAGEVVERPASAVKELIENALDAGARNIKIRLREGGRLSIVVEDDGCGIAFEDLPLALAPHATSKIENISDLESIRTLGYRGEALASLTAIAKIEVRSRIDGENGGMIRAQDGHVTEHLTASCAQGTRIQVDDIFEQMPARRKFLKTARGELSRVAACVREYAVARPDVRFVLENDNRLQFASDGIGDRTRTLAQFWGTEPHDIQYVKSQAGNLSLECWWQSRPGRNDIMAFVNGRAVHDPAIKSAVSVGARELIGNWALFFMIDPALVDVNIHPTKAEVRFRNNDEIFRAVRLAAAQLGHPASFSGSEFGMQSLEKNVSSSRTAVKTTRLEDEPGPENLTLTFTPVDISDIPDNDNNATSAPMTLPTSPSEPPTETSFSKQKQKRSQSQSQPKKTKRPFKVAAAETERGWIGLTGESSTATLPTERPSRQNYSGRTDNFSSTATLSPFISSGTNHDNRIEKVDVNIALESQNVGQNIVYMGQTSTGYLLFDDGKALILLDPHAAHERVKYEQIKRAVSGSRNGNAQGLIVPVQLPPTLALEALEYRGELEIAGFALEERNGCVMLKSVPTLPDSVSEPEALLRTSLAALKNGRDGDVREILWRTWATMACKSAVKLTTNLTPDEARSLRRDLMACEQPYFCPHGRPTILRLDMMEIARRFERGVVA